MNDDGFMRRDEKMDFPHYPQSYPQIMCLQPQISMVSDDPMWIASITFELIQRILLRTSAFVHKFSRALSTENVKFRRRVRHRIVII